MIRRLRTVLLSALMLLLLCVPAHAEGVSRALLIGCDLFVSQDDTSPAAENNVTRMHSALDSAVTPFASITANVNEVVSDVMLEALVPTFSLHCDILRMRTGTIGSVLDNKIF